MDPAAETQPSAALKPHAPVGRSPNQAVCRLLLASKSPRRRTLLQEAGIDHDVIESGIDDGQLSPGSVSPEQWVAALAYMKAAAASLRWLHERTGSAIILGADTVVVDRGEVIGQPRDRADAERIIHRLSDGSHGVVTGVALVDPATGRRELFSDRAEVTVGALDPDSVRDYLDSNEWRGKAGAYNLAERLAAGWPITIDGDPGTVMGLPMRLLVRRLEAFGRS